MPGKQYTAAVAGDDRILSLLRTVYRIGGWRALWGGLGPTLIRDTPFSALYWSGYEAMRVWLRGHQPEGFATNFVAGAISGMFGGWHCECVPLVGRRLDGFGVLGLVNGRFRGTSLGHHGLNLRVEGP